jgi:hypothetical protein
MWSLMSGFSPALADGNNEARKRTRILEIATNKGHSAGKKFRSYYLAKTLASAVATLLLEQSAFTRAHL